MSARKKETKKSIIIKAIIKWTILLTALVASIIFFMISPLFNIREIQVVGNQRVSKDTIISLSRLSIGENIYKTSSNKIKKNIKENAYIGRVDIKKILPNKIIINVKERKPTYMLEYASSYAYINNQGYILEISKEALEIPIITGYSTKDEDIIPGCRLNEEDLGKLEVVLKIMEVANGNEIGNLITRFNIQNKQDYIVIMDEEKKTIHLGDATNLSTRIPYVKAILTGEKGVEGDIFVNVDLNKQNAYFRRKE